MPFAARVVVGELGLRRRPMAAVVVVLCVNDLDGAGRIGR